MTVVRVRVKNCFKLKKQGKQTNILSCTDECYELRISDIQVIKNQITID